MMFHVRLSPRAACVLASLMALSFATPARADDWPQWLGPQRDGVWREDGILRQLPEDGPKVLWRTKVAAGYTGPAVALGKVYLMDRQAQVDEQGAPVADEEGAIQGNERILCFNAENGELIWKHQYNCPYKLSYPLGPRTTPLIEGNRVYTLGAMGHLKCLAADSGKLHWELDLPQQFATQPPVWGYAAHPFIDGDRLICLVGGKQSAIVALDKTSGKVIWQQLTVEEVGYAPPVFLGQGKQRQLVYWHDLAVVGLKPQTGELLWSVPFPPGGMPQRPAVTIMTPRVAGTQVFVSNFYDGSMVIDVNTDVPSAKQVWVSDKVNDALHKNSLNAIMTTPFIADDHVYGVSGNGEMRCLKLQDGSFVWREVKATGERPSFFATCFIVRQADRYFLFNDQGFLIIAEMSPAGYREISRAKLLKPTSSARGRDMVWSHPAFAYKSMFARNDEELIRVDLSAESQGE